MDTEVWGAAESWAKEEVDELCHSFGLDAKSPPREWSRAPESWEVGRRVTRLAFSLLELIKSDYTTPLPDPNEVERLLRMEIHQPYRDETMRLRAAWLRAAGESVPEPPVIWKTRRIPTVDLLTKLLILLLDRAGMEWEARGSVPRLLDIAAFPIPSQSLLPAVAKFRLKALEAYIHGYASAAITWCRSAVERQLNATLVAGGLEFPYSEMRERVRTAVVHHLLDPALERAARQVFIRAGTTVHDDPEAVRDALGTVRSAMILLDDMQRRWPS